MADVTVGSRNTCYRAARCGLTRTGLAPVGLHQLVLAPSEIEAETYALFQRDGKPWPNRDWEVDVETFCFYKD